MENLKREVEAQLKKAFFDLLEERINSTPPDYDWLINLYSEIVKKMTVFLKQESQLCINIKENMDVELFAQMIRNNAFDSSDMVKLVTYTFDTIMVLGSPARDNETCNMKNEVINLMKEPNPTFGSVVSAYLKYTHICIDNYHTDFENSIKKYDIIKDLKNSSDKY